jgi:hypothetical protein
MDFDFSLTRGLCETIVDAPVNLQTTNCVGGWHCGEFFAPQCVMYPSGNRQYELVKNQVILLCVKTGELDSVMNFTVWTRRENIPGVNWYSWVIYYSEPILCPVTQIPIQFGSESFNFQLSAFESAFE